MNRRRRTDEPVKNIHKETEYHTVVTDDGMQDEGFNCKACGKFITVRDCGTNNRNHCPHCLSSIHLDNIPGDRSADCGGIMEPISIYVRPDGEWALIHRCKKCGELKINRIAADDNEYLLLSLACKPLAIRLSRSVLYQHLSARIISKQVRGCDTTRKRKSESKRKK